MDLAASIMDTSAILGFDDLRVRHSELLHQRRSRSDEPAFHETVRRFIIEGAATGGLLNQNDERTAAQAFLDFWANYLDSCHVPPPESTLDKFDIDRAPKLDDALCPYVGLNAFHEEQHKLFFGRDRLLQQMTEVIGARRFMAVVGSSGSGKSSLVLGGFVPRLKDGAVPGSKNWRYLSRALVPGSDPLSGLARLLSESLAPISEPPLAADWAQSQAEVFRSEPGHLARLLDQISPVPVLLVIDQFEELFTLCMDQRARSAFIDSLAFLAQSQGVAHRVVLTLRIDFEDRILRYRDLNILFEQSRVSVKALSDDELRDAIEKPARGIGLEFEQGVVADLIKDVLGEPAGLPLLQFTLRRLWDKRRSKWITREAYEALGGACRALASSADEFYDKLPHADQRALKLIMLRLVRTSEGLEVFNNRMPRESLYAGNVARDWIDNLMPKLVNAGLVRLTGDPPDEQVEISHEALIRNWPHFTSWLDNDRANLTTRRRLDAKAAEWVRLGRGIDGLLPDERQLGEGKDWLGSEEAELLGFHEALPDLVEASEAAFEAQRLTAIQQAAAEGSNLMLRQQRAKIAAGFRSLSIVVVILLIIAVADFFAATIYVARVKVALRNTEVTQKNLKLAQSNVNLLTDELIRVNLERVKEKSRALAAEQQVKAVQSNAANGRRFADD